MICKHRKDVCIDLIWLKQKYYAPQVRPDRGSNSWPPDHDSTFHVTEMPSLTTWPSVSSKKKCTAVVWELRFQMRELSDRLIHWESISLDQVRLKSHTWYWMFLPRPGVFKQPKLNLIPNPHTFSISFWQGATEGVLFPGSNKRSLSQHALPLGKYNSEQKHITFIQAEWLNVCTLNGE